jgi:Protein of unknown function (DUF1203)
MAFRISGLPAEPLAHWFTMDDTDLARAGAVRRVADSHLGFPCRVSLTDAAVGEEVLLINFEHLPDRSPYRSRHAIYIRRGEIQCEAIDAVPVMLCSRLLSVRGFVDGRELEKTIEAFFTDARTRYLHIHFAKPGCYAARVDRH